MTSGRAFLYVLLPLIIVLCDAQWETDSRRRVSTRNLGISAMKMIEYIKEHSSIYDEWLVKVVGNLKVSDGFKSISVPDNILELWNIMSENPSQMEKKIDELTPHNIGMPEEEKLMCAIVSRYIWEKLSRDQYDHDATSESLTLTFKLTYEEILPPYLAMSEYLSKGRKTKKAEQKMAHIKTAG